MAIFLRESRTRHSLLTRNKTFHDNQIQLKTEDIPGDTAENPGISADGEIMIESDSEPDLELHDIPESADDVASGDRKRKNKGSGAGYDAGNDEKKLRFSTHYESFNICGWVLCLLISRKGGKARSSAGVSESTRQPLMEEWISTQAQASVDED